MQSIKANDGTSTFNILRLKLANIEFTASIIKFKWLLMKVESYSTEIMHNSNADNGNNQRKLNFLDQISFHQYHLNECSKIKPDL